MGQEYWILKVDGMGPQYWVETEIQWEGAFETWDEAAEFVAEEGGTLVSIRPEAVEVK